jgi:uridine kinase
LEAVLERLLAGRPARLPCYDFETHSRLARTRLLSPKQMILLDGLWLLRRRAVRRLLSFSVFLDCPRGTRLRRRVARDLLSRGRARTSIQQQFRNTVEPMHARFVAPQTRWAELVLRKPCDERAVVEIANRLRRLFLGAPAARPMPVGFG